MDHQASPDGMAVKYARLASVVNDYPADSGAQTAISVFRATPRADLIRGEEFAVKMMERHAYTSQAFIPMGKGEASSSYFRRSAIVADCSPVERKRRRRIASWWGDASHRSFERRKRQTGRIDHQSIQGPSVNGYKL